MAARGLEGRLDAGEVGRGHWRVTLLSGWAAGIGRIGGIVGPYLVGVMLGAPGLGTTVIFLMFAAVLLVIAADVWLLGEETRGRTLGEISGQEAPAG